VVSNLDSLIEASPDPQTTAFRFERLSEDREIMNSIVRLPQELLASFIKIISISKFLFHFICRHPDAIDQLGVRYVGDGNSLAKIVSLDELRIHKYYELFKITWMDLAGACKYQEILHALSDLAVTITQKTLELCTRMEHREIVTKSMTVMALGKLGACELNYSSDIDLIFVTVNPEDSPDDYQVLQGLLIDALRSMNRALEQKTAEGFLYRVDMKLRPWGRSGPLVMAIDDTENYYAASSEPWERFAWLRARPIAGSVDLAADLLTRLHPFVFKRSLGSDDLQHFVEIKDNMSKARRRQGHWNVKVGRGGIRDVEFFIQILQLVNAGRHAVLQTTSTLTALSGLRACGLISVEEEHELHESYIFLRRLENRLQMFEENQTHDLPDERNRRLILARSLTRSAANMDNDQILNEFEEELIAHQSIAAKYFERVLPAKD
jgi:glutamate-ammonia-ligase adenylyltransferase